MTLRALTKATTHRQREERGTRSFFEQNGMENYYGSSSGGFYGSDGAQQPSQQPQSAYHHATPTSSWNPASNSQQASQQTQQASHQSSASGYYGNDGQQWRQPASQPQQGYQYNGPQQMLQMNALPPQAPAPAATTAAAAASPSFWNPTTAATMAAVAGSLASSASGGKLGVGGSVDAGTMLDFASTAGKTFLQSGTARMIPGLEAAMQLLRRYFAVDNQYVVKKMKRVFFPFLNKNWQRTVCTTGEDPEACPINSTRMDSLTLTNFSRPLFF
jgi:YIF1